MNDYKLFETHKWANGYGEGVVYCFLWGKVSFEYELSQDRRFRPCYLRQWGGDHIYQTSISMFGRSLALYIWPLY